MAFVLMLIVSAAFFTACTDESPADPTPQKQIIHKTDGRTVKLSDPSGIALDVNADGAVDYNIFVELTANSAGDRLYAGINPIGNPIGTNAILAGPAIDENFLSMGFAKALAADTPIPENPSGDLQWSPDFHALAIRNTFTSGAISYEGDWGNGSAAFLPLRLDEGGLKKYGWAKLSFNKTTEVMTLEEYAYSEVAGVTLAAGEK